MRQAQRYRLKEKGSDLKKVIERVQAIFYLSKQEIMSPSRQVKRAKAEVYYVIGQSWNLA